MKAYLCTYHYYLLKEKEIDSIILIVDGTVVDAVILFNTKIAKSYPEFFLDHIETIDSQVYENNLQIN